MDVLLEEVGDSRTSRGGRAPGTSWGGRGASTSRGGRGPQYEFGEVGGQSTSRGGRGPKCFSMR